MVQNCHLHRPVHESRPEESILSDAQYRILAQQMVELNQRLKNKPREITYYFLQINGRQVTVYTQLRINRGRYEERIRTVELFRR